MIALKLFIVKVRRKKLFATMVHKKAAACRWRLVVCFLYETPSAAFLWTIAANSPKGQGYEWDCHLAVR